MQQQMDDLDELSGDSDVDNTGYARRGIVVWPTFHHLPLGQEKTFYVYVHKDLGDFEGAQAIADADNEALAILNEYRIDELPVVDDDGRPVGVIDVQDLLGIKTVTDGED